MVEFDELLKAVERVNKERQSEQADRGKEGGRGNKKETLPQKVGEGFDSHANESDEKIAALAGTNRQYVSDAKKLKEKAGVEEVPCWVKDMGDEEAHMLLLLCNNQKEHDPLERGIHALNHTEKGKWGQSVRAYAMRAGKKRQLIQDNVQAARVAKVAGQPATLFRGRAEHLATIHSLPKSCWPEACAVLLDKELSVKDTQEAVKQTKEFLAAFKPDKWEDYLPPERCASRVFAGLDPKNFTKLLDNGGAVLDKIGCWVSQ